jgi:hypothetical protein
MILSSTKGYKKVYKSDIYKILARHKDKIWTCIDQDKCVSHHLYRHLEDYLITKSLSEGYYNKDKQILHVTCLTHRPGTKESIILTPQKVNRIIC